MNNIKEVIKGYNSDRIHLLNSEKLKDDLKFVPNQIAYNDMWFEMEDDNDLMEACIYQREILKARYRYLLRKAKESKSYLSPF